MAPNLQLQPYELHRLDREVAHMCHSTAHEIAANIRAYNQGWTTEEECDDSLLCLMYGIDGSTEDF